MLIFAVFSACLIPVLMTLVSVYWLAPVMFLRHLAHLNIEYTSLPTDFGFFPQSLGEGIGHLSTK